MNPGKTPESGPRVRRVTLLDIAQQLGVSRATVSRSLNAVEDPYISDATREKVREVAREMGYRPNHAARSLLTGRTGLLALWLYTSHGHTSYHAAVTKRMCEVAGHRHYPMLVDPIQTRGDIRPFDRWNVDGIIAHEAAAALGQDPRPPVPFVTTGVFQLVQGVDAVQIDLYPGAVEAMRHLLDGGRRSIAYVTDDLDFRQGDVRYLAYREAMDAAGLEPRYIDVPYDRAGARAAIRAEVQSRGVPDAMYCHNDDLALGIYRGLCDLGIKVPDDVAILGCDGIEDLEYLEVPITTIQQPLDQMCELAFGMLETRIEDPSLPLRFERLEARLVVRESTGK